MKAIVLAAGYATRLYPLTRDRAKPLLEVGGRPILSHIADRVLELPDLSELVVVSNARFAAQFEDWAHSREQSLPVRVLNDGSTCEDDRLGASGDLAFALREVPPGDEDVLVVAGDNLMDLDLRPAHAMLRESGCPTLIVRRAEPESGRSRYNEVNVEDDGSVRAMSEKPEQRQSELSAIAVYFYPPTITAWVEEYLTGGGNPDAPGHFASWLVDRTRVMSVPLVGRWFDIGSAETLAAAREAFAR